MLKFANFHIGDLKKEMKNLCSIATEPVRKIRGISSEWFVDEETMILLHYLFVGFFLPYFEVIRDTYHQIKIPSMLLHPATT